MHKQQDLAPIVIPVYKRLEHLKICINSLLSNEIAKNTELYIYSDNAFSEKDQVAIDKLRVFVKNLSGFKRIIIKEQAVNKGLGNIREAIEATLKLHPAIIYLEEDLEVSTHFLQFMNEQLVEHQNDPHIFSISGYSLPCFSGDRGRILGSNSFTAWGCGLWSNKYAALCAYFDVESLLDRLSALKVAIPYIARYGIGSFNQIRKKLYQGKLTPDITIGTYLWLTKKIQLFPVQSLVDTHGFDGSGWHCNNTEKFRVQIANSNFEQIQKFELDPIEVNSTQNKIIAYHRLGLKEDLRKFVRDPFFYIKKIVM
jgi:hypothetical protein